MAVPFLFGIETESADDFIACIESLRTLFQVDPATIDHEDCYLTPSTRISSACASLSSAASFLDGVKAIRWSLAARVR